MNSDPVKCTNSDVKVAVPVSPDVHLENEGKTIGGLTMGTCVESPMLD